MWPGAYSLTMAKTTRDAPPAGADRPAAPRAARLPGVYLFYDSDGELLYVGKARSIRKRVASHFSGGETRADLAGRPHRRAGHRQRGRGAARRAELHQAPPAALQHPPARRQVLPLRRASASTRTTRGSTSPARSTAPAAPTSAPSPAPSGCARPSTCSASSSSSAPARAPSPAGARAAPASTTTSSAAGRPASATSARRSTGATSTRSSTSSPAATARSRPTSRRRWRRRRRRGNSSGPPSTATGSTAIQSLFERQRVAGGSVGTADLIGVAAEGADANVQVFQVRDGILAERQSFYLENQAERDQAEVAEEFIGQYYSASPSMPKTIVVGPYLRERAELLAEALERAPRRAGRGAGRRARRQAPPARAGRAQRPPRPRPGPPAPRAPPPAPGRVARRPPRRARHGGAAGADRGLRHLQPRRRAHRRLDGRVRGRCDQEGRLPPVPGARRAAERAPTTSPRWRRCSAAA